MKLPLSTLLLLLFLLALVVCEDLVVDETTVGSPAIQSDLLLTVKSLEKRILELENGQLRKENANLQSKIELNGEKNFPNTNGGQKGLVSYRIENVLNVTQSQFNSSCNSGFVGIQRIWPAEFESPIAVRCDNGKISIGKLRLNNFWERPWMEVEYGSDLTSDRAWIGLANLHQLTTVQPYSLMVFSEDDDSLFSIKQFQVGSKAENYRISGQFTKQEEGNERHRRGHRHGHRHRHREENSGSLERKMSDCFASKPLEWWHCLALGRSVIVEIQ